MKFKRIANTFLAFSLSLFFSCGDTKHNHAAEEPRTEKEAVEAHSHEDGNELSLNQGEKWQANPETTEGVKSMQGRIDFYQNNSGAQSLQELHDGLKSDFDAIFKNCTMKGEAHNQLHHFLIPMKEKLELIESGGEESGDKVVQELKDHLKRYDTFFE